VRDGHAFTHHPAARLPPTRAASTRSAHLSPPARDSGRFGVHPDRWSPDHRSQSTACDPKLTYGDETNGWPAETFVSPADVRAAGASTTSPLCRKRLTAGARVRNSGAAPSTSQKGGGSDAPKPAPLRPGSQSPPSLAGITALTGARKGGAPLGLARIVAQNAHLEGRTPARGPLLSQQDAQFEDVRPRMSARLASETRWRCV